MSVGPDNHERVAALYRAADDYMERSRRSAGGGSSVGTREWLEAANAALTVAATIRGIQLAEAEARG